MAHPALFGMETEFGFAAIGSSGQRVDDEAAMAVFEAVRRDYACLNGGGSRLHLQNGGLLYLDGGHLEWATPEVMSPTELVAYQCGGEKMLEAIVAELEQQDQYAEIRVFKSNVDYVATHSTWGCHESYLYTRTGRLISIHLIPFLVSRVIFTGAGGLKVHSRGIEFSLSPRVGHLRASVSSGSTNGRGIFHTRNEPLAIGNYNRLHVLCGDSNCSQFQTWLKTGTLALVMAALDAGERPGDGLKLNDPVGTMHAIAADAECTYVAKIKDGRRLTAIDIQRQYLAMVEQLIDSPIMPEWAGDVCQAWRRTLDALASEPATLHDQLDWPLKKALFDHRIAAQTSVDPESITVWNDVLSRIEAAIETWNPERRRVLTDQVIDTTYVKRRINRRGEVGTLLTGLTQVLGSHGLDWEQLDDFIKLRFELCEFDTRFGELGTRGVFASLDLDGLLKHRIVSEDEVERARCAPPSAGRARVRGEVISRLAAEGVAHDYHCGWALIVGPGSRLDLGDPFDEIERWIPPPDSPTDDPNGDLFGIPAFLQRHGD